eukprot:m.20799 g.20799  ORF g.20799 m.20799 type:complete len:673 (+) comp3829_c0_seq1:86-2104(+)
MHRRTPGRASTTVTTLFAVLVASMASAAPQKPHIVFNLVDDNGWAGVGYNNPYLNTPTLDSLAKGGLTLTAHYVYQYCAPTRGSFLTGRFPYRLAATRSNFIPWTLPDGTNLGYAMLPKKLQAANYRSYHIGKWHQGIYTPEYTPVGRGFTESYGFLEGGEDHNTSETFGNWCKKHEVDLSIGRAGGAGSGTAPYPYTWPACTWVDMPNVAVHNFFDNASIDITGYNPYAPRFASEAGCKAICENRMDCVAYSWRSQDPTQMHYHQCFLVSALGNPAPVNNAFQSARCVRQHNTTNVGTPKAGATTITASGDNGTYTGILFSNEAVRVVHEHATLYADQPMFMYFAMHDTHAPLEAPWEYVAPYAAKFPNDTKRSIFSGMIAFVDATVKNLTTALKETGMWDNTLYVWTNDNGSPVSVGGSNHPLRGGKGSDWEGGTRVPTFVTGGLLPPSQAGKTHNGLIHISDWHVTILKLAGLDPTVGEPNAPAPLDGMDAWPWISGTEENSARHDIVYSHRMFTFANETKAPCYNLSTPEGRKCVTGTVQRDGWKLVVGPIHQNGWFGWFSPNASVPLNKSSPALTNSACFPDAPCLFNLNDSITEHEDVAASNPDIVSSLLEWFDSLATEYHPPMKDPPTDLDGYCAAVEGNFNFVGPWQRLANDELLADLNHMVST